jgi:hypothetical protein
MYGQKTGVGFLSAGITIASWWMWGITIMLAAVAVILYVRVFISIHGRNATQRP